MKSAQWLFSHGLDSAINGISKRLPDSSSSLSSSSSSTSSSPSSSPRTTPSRLRLASPTETATRLTALIATHVRHLPSTSYALLPRFVRHADLFFTTSFPFILTDLSTSPENGNGTGNGTGNGKRKPLHPTSYLDALRGLAALIVVNHHFFPFESLQWPYAVFRVPPLSLVVAGRGMVDVFFVISGYVLSYRVLQLLRLRQQAGKEKGGPPGSPAGGGDGGKMEGKLLSALSGSVLRRYGRLYASAGIAMFISMLCAWFNLGVDHPVTKRPSLWLQLRHFADDFGRFSNPFVPIEGFWHADVFKPEYLLVLWTIPIEFRGSLVVFLVLVGCAGMVSRARMGSAVVLIGACYYWLTTFAALFLGGMVLADVGFERFPQRLGGGAGAGPGAARTNANPNPNPRDEPTLPHSSRDPDPEKKPLFQDEGETYSIRQKVLYATLLLTSLLLLSQPTTPLLESHWPWPYLDRLIPTSFATSPQKEHFFLSIGSLLLVFVLDSFPPFQKPLNWPLMQYFGEVSFGVYTMHLLVLWCFWRPVLEPIKLRWLGEGMAANLPFWVVFWVAILWAGEGFCVLDKLVVKGGRWMQNWLFDV